MPGRSLFSPREDRRCHILRKTGGVALSCKIQGEHGSFCGHFFRMWLNRDFAFSLHYISGTVSWGRSKGKILRMWRCVDWKRFGREWCTLLTVYYYSRPTVQCFAQRWDICHSHLCAQTVGSHPGILAMHATWYNSAMLHPVSLTGAQSSYWPARV